MGVFTKLKEVLFDVDEEEIPVIKKEEKVPIIKRDDNPIKEVKMPKDDFLDDIEPIENDAVEPQKIKKESNFNFPLDFEDELPARSKRDYFDEDFTSRVDREVKREEPIKSRNDYEYDYSRLDIKEVKKNETKNFKPSPVISPVYGILDQNYTKDDVIVKNDGSKRKPDLDDVRKKAYGKNKKQEDKDEFEEPLKTLDEILIDKEDKKDFVDEVVVKEEAIVSEPDEDNSPANLIYDDELPDEPYADEELEDKNLSREDELESDLFNLIDSMYEEKIEREEEE